MSKRTIKLELEFDFEQVVYLKTDTDQLPRMVTDLTIKPTGAIVYSLTQGTHTSWHYSFEISETKTF